MKNLEYQLLQQLKSMCNVSKSKIEKLLLQLTCTKRLCHFQQTGEIQIVARN